MTDTDGVRTAGMLVWVRSDTLRGPRHRARLIDDPAFPGKLRPGVPLCGARMTFAVENSRGRVCMRCADVS